MEKSDKFIYLILISIIAVWGLNVVMVKFLVQFLDPLPMTAFRMLLAGIFFLPFIWRKYGWYKPSGSEWAFLAAIGLMSVFLHQMTLAYGIQSTSATNTSLILGLNPLVTTILAAIFVGEKLSFRLVAGVILGFSGVFLVVFGSSLGTDVRISGIGDVLTFLAMLAYVIGALLVKKTSATSIPTMVITAYSTLIGAVMLFIASFAIFGPGVYGQAHFTASAWAVLLFSAWAATSLGALGFNFAIKTVGAGRTAIFINGLPFAGMVSGIIFYREKVGWLHLVAFLLTTSGILIASSKKSAVGAAREKDQPLKSAQ
jgi:drug/metabolite transporter (DMT)-like permease